MLVPIENATTIREAFVALRERLRKDERIGSYAADSAFVESIFYAGAQSVVGLVITEALPERGRATKYQHGAALLRAFAAVHDELIGWMLAEQAAEKRRQGKEFSEGEQ
jgi:hypothetical protein